ncbi:carboxypeptidase regulatory-like domain-containing protein [bacterium]|nr:carboxypeptidase regulatory-like domain-containing protein [bacterium]
MTRKYQNFMGMLLIAVFALVAFNAEAVQVRPNMLESRLAEVEIVSKADLTVITEAGGIIDNVQGNIARVYLLEEDFNSLQMRGYVVRWIRDEAKEYGLWLTETTRHTDDDRDDYHTNDEIETQFITWQATYPTLFSYESIGLSYQGRDLWACKLSDNVTVDEPEIEVKYISTMHGDEPVGTEMCMYLIEDLLTQYGSDPELTELMTDFEIWIIPMMNPDGNALVQRVNAQGYDLNRNFPDRVDDSVNTTAGRPTEVGLVMDWVSEHNFVLSINFHGGALVANYPFDNNYTHTSGIYTASPEDDLFIHLSLTYSQYNLPMYNGSWPQGITNGTDWYCVSGGMQDWNYVWMGDKEITVELGNTKWPSASQLPTYWADNETSMRKYLLEAKYGVHGIVTDSITGDPLRAEIMLGSSPYLTYSTELHGDYYRILENGTYSLTFSAPGYQSKTFPSVVVSGGIPTVLDVELARIPSPIISTDPTAISESIGICDSLDVSFTIINSGDYALNWSAEEGFIHEGGYGGAVGGGWRFIDSDQTGGPVYDWVDISGLGSELSFTSDDQNLGPYSIGFSFPFYGQTFNSIHVAANGWISFTSSATGEASWRNQYLPDNTMAPENIIAAWWDDLSPQRTGAEVRMYTNNSDSLIVTFSSVESYADDGLYTFQYILLSSGEIIFQYNDMGTNRLNSSTIGLQDNDRKKGSTVIYNELYIHDNMAISWCPNSMVVLIPDNGTVPPQSSQPVTARLKSCCLPLGSSSGILEITSNDPATPLLEIQVDLNVSAQPPQAVTDLVILPESPNVHLFWTSAAYANSYDIYRSQTYPVELIPANFVDSVADTHYVDTGVSAESAGFYVVTSVQ